MDHGGLVFNRRDDYCRLCLLESPKKLIILGVGAASQPWIPADEIWIADAHHGDGKRLVVRADEKLTAFIELQWAIRA